MPKSLYITIENDIPRNIHKNERDTALFMDVFLDNNTKSSMTKDKISILKAIKKLILSKIKNLNNKYMNYKF